MKSNDYLISAFFLLLVLAFYYPTHQAGFVTDFYGWQDKFNQASLKDVLTTFGWHANQQVSVFFSDIVSFTELSQSVTAEELVALLNGIFSQFDQLTRKHGLEKIKTIGDAYMAVAGAPVRVEDHAARAASFAVDVANFMEHYHTPSGEKIGLRIGLHTGSVVAGIIGENKFAYDLWGDAVNTASRMESHGEAGKIHVSEEFMQALKTAIAGGTGRDLSLQPHSSLSSLQSLLSFSFQERGELDIKGKGIMKTYFLEKA